MGFLDKIKKAVSAVPQVMPSAPPPAPAPQPEAEPEVEAEPEASYDGPTFVWDGTAYPLPSGWSDLSIEDWFVKFETLRERMMHADRENLQAMTDRHGHKIDPEEVLLITQYGFEDGGHYEKYRNWAVHNWARQTGENPTDVEFRMGTIARDKLRAAKAGKMAAPGGALAPVEGIDLQRWAQLQAKIAGGAEPNGLVASAGIDPATWGRVSAEWNRRMSTDTSGTVASAYANAFASGAVGPYGAAAAQAASAGVGGNLGPEPVPFELFVEVTEAQRAAAKRGEDAIALLASFNLKPIDWSNIGMYWNRRIAQEATKYHNLYTQLGAKYAAKYGNGDGLTNDQREEKVLATILQMARTGQAAQILPYLRKYFPEDAESNSTMNWWLDKACDRCVPAGDRASAQQLLVLRYPLQDGETDPMAEWVASRMERLF